MYGRLIRIKTLEKLNRTEDMIQIATQISLLMLLLFMGVQDFRYRAISWYAFPLLAVLMMFENKDFRLVDAIVNIGFLLVNFILAALIISLRNKSYVNLLHAHIGLGDLLMLACLALYFTPINFFVFYLSSLLFISITLGIYLGIAKPKTYTVPLAGMQGMLLFGCIILTSAYGVKLNNIQWFENYIL